LCIQLLIDNGYPFELIFNTITRRLKKLSVIKSVNDRNRSLQTITTNSEKKIIVFPYIKPITEIMASTINKSNHIIGYRCLTKLRKFVKTHKDKKPRTSNNNEIHKIACKDCDALYVGQTKRQLKTRLREHKNNIRHDYSKHTVVSKHIVNFNHAFDWKNVQILDHEHNYC